MEEEDGGDAIMVKGPIHCPRLVMFGQLRRYTARRCWPTATPAQPKISKVLHRRHLQRRRKTGVVGMGILVDRPRGRLLVVYSDIFGNCYGGLGAYDLVTWRHLFLTQLSGLDDEPFDANDVAVDGEGNAYVIDAKSNKLWKVGPGKALLLVIRIPTFTQSKKWYRNLLGLNGIVHHPDGYLLVIHTFGNQLFKLDAATGEVTVVQVSRGTLLLGDGLELLSPTKLVVVGGSTAGRTRVPTLMAAGAARERDEGELLRRWGGREKGGRRKRQRGRR
ncbi:hypothetical protein Taro_037687 [Colocasia esculenta]|uniref:Uncharacterized protein n=1 Tax=Colocasia esculenta TaxID=4460 RepID=A0A843WBR9_COLES|nr:hypothetical protein [Colocasia esculenta]